MNGAIAGRATALDVLAAVIDESGPIPAARLSSAQARGAAKKYAYWGVARYQIRRRASDGAPAAVALERASSTYRSRAKAGAALREYCEEHGRVPVDRVGGVSAGEAVKIVGWLAQRGLVRPELLAEARLVESA